jgi:hypothetical protein
MEDIEMAMFVALYVALIQALLECRPSFETADCLATELACAIHSPMEDVQVAVSTAALHDYRLRCGLLCQNDELRYWVKPRSTTWFNEFLVYEYDDRRWIEQFRMSKANIADMCNKLKPLIEKQNTKYRLAVPVEIRVCCTIYKLAQGANINQCSELFAIGKSTVGKVLREVVQAITTVYKYLIQWPSGHRLQTVMHEFQDWCGLPSIHGAIDYTHIEISRPAEFPEDYYYYKTSRYSLVAQAVVDAKKRFTDIFVGLPGSVNDMRILRKSGLYRKAQRGGLMQMLPSNCQDGIPPYLLGDKGYPLLSWILTPFKDDGQPRSIIERIYNKKHRRGRSVVENAFGLMKQSWREMLKKTELNVKFVPDVVLACCILHNMVMGAEQV